MTINHPYFILKRCVYVLLSFYLTNLSPISHDKKMVSKHTIILYLIQSSIANSLSTVLTISNLKPSIWNRML